MTFAKEDKWKMVSHIQKSIRRGYINQLDLITRELYKLDHNYLRYRINVILSEDIGIANASLVNEIQEDKINKRWIESNGGIDFLIDKLKLLAGSVKDRTACEFGSIASIDNFKHETGKEWFDTTILEAINIAWDESKSLPVRSSAVFKAIGTSTFEHSQLPEKIEGSWDDWIASMRDHKVDENIIIMMNNGKKTQREWHPAFLGLCSKNAEVSNSIKIKKLTETQLCGPYVCEAIDGHTAEGKKAISQLWLKHPTLKNEWLDLGYIKSYDDTMWLLKKIIFMFEGGVLDKQLDYSLANEILNIKKENWKTNIEINAQQAAVSVWNSMPYLNNIRRTLIDSQLIKNNIHLNLE